MGDAVTLTVHELTARQNWPGRPVPEWADEGARLYTVPALEVAGQEWRHLVATYDGESTTLSLTHAGFDTARRGPALHVVSGKGACYRRAVREWFRDTYRAEVRFA